MIRRNIDGGATSPRNLGETETKPPGSDSVATAGLLPWLTKAVTTAHLALQKMLPNAEKLKKIANFQFW